MHIIKAPFRKHWKTHQVINILTSTISDQKNFSNKYLVRTFMLLVKNLTMFLVPQPQCLKQWQNTIHPFVLKQNLDVNLCLTKVTMYV